MKRDDYGHVPSSSSEDLVSETQNFFEESKIDTQSRKQNKRMMLATSLILLATFLNVICLYFWLRPGTASSALSTSETPIIWDYFLNDSSGKRLPESVTRTYWDYHDDFLNENLTIAHDFWASLFPPGEGLVALTDTEVSALQLHESNRAWKEPTKHIYLVAVFHQLHCLSVLRAQTIKLWQNPSFSIADATYHHTMHCVDILRQGLLCAADSTLIFKTNDIKWPGEGGNVTCRNFEALKEWTLSRDYVSSPNEPEFHDASPKLL
ncbi:hypothetical protein C7974DRAFT_402562 [Boeremia exigua]|uniref:uncharacterized protein n=1 Tax=Boeremia exigua TaxID=749465 RepID=UPI001E8DE7E8|nr:uncharacterized protein C7974DRAFT_402562 [Boeremia exigua]KAH6616857.1 hypothetical protein C7974DRAFT_402562 [Boeremia exigua]